MGCVMSDDVQPVHRNEFKREPVKDINMVDPPRVVSEHSKYTREVDLKCQRSYYDARTSIQRKNEKKQEPLRINVVDPNKGVLVVRYTSNNCARLVPVVKK